MGFGSYDEEEQEDQDAGDLDTDDGVNVHEKDHQGSVEFETDESAEELVDRLGEMKDEE